jgi:hypothetical protein
LTSVRLALKMLFAGRTDAFRDHPQREFRGFL